MDSKPMAIETQRSPLISQYWAFQLGGWAALTIFNTLSLNIWYTPGQFAPLVHSVLQSIAGMFLSHPIRLVARSVWQRNFAPRLIIVGSAVLAAAAAWTAWRITTFTFLTGETIYFSDWGGWINVSVIVFVAWAVSYHAFRYYRQSIEQRRIAAEAQALTLAAQAKAQSESMKRLEAESLFRESQLRMLKYQLNPHFFLNALNSVSALVQRNKKDDAMEMLARIGDFLRLSLNDDVQMLHSLEEELDAIDSYLGIEKIRFGDRLITEFEVEPDLLNLQLPILLLQPLFENSIKHAVGKRMDPTVLTFQAIKRTGGVELTLSDNGPGLSDLESSNGSDSPHLGLTNVEQRLKAAFGDKAHLELRNSDQGGVKVQITLKDA
ncbi:MAG: sensor histidine kinase [Henriciella sp.]